MVFLYSINGSWKKADKIIWPAGRYVLTATYLLRKDRKREMSSWDRVKEHMTLTKKRGKLERKTKGLVNPGASKDRTKKGLFVPGVESQRN